MTLPNRSRCVSQSGSSREKTSTRAERPGPLLGHLERMIAVEVLRDHQEVGAGIDRAIGNEFFVTHP